MVKYKVPKAIGKVSKNYDTEIHKSNFMDYLMSYGVRITALNTGLASTEIYRVPAGSTLFIIGLSLAGTNAAAGTANFQLFLYPNSINSLVYLRISNGAPKETNFSYSLPLRINTGEIIQASSDSANFSIAGGVIGYLIPTALIPNFI